MKFTLSWLREYLDTSAPLDTILEVLTRIGLEVEDVHNPAENLRSFPIVDVLEAKKHPQADRLKVLTVNTGSEVVTVVCGDPKVTQGTKGVLALPGSYVPGLDVRMKVSKIRGVDSHGMMCSLQELGLAETAEGIIQLPKDVPIGMPYVDYAGLDDPRIEIAITPNRGDCLGVMGIARDLAAAGVGTFIPPQIDPVQGDFKNPFEITIASQSHEACPMFVGRLIKGVRNGPSPQWLKQRVESVGLRSISALVDVTNLLAYELGRPMHVFDADKIQGAVQVRFAQKGEMLKALDEKTYDLDETMIVVADEKAPLSLAGIMGGLDSGCTEETTNVFVESAVFDPGMIAQTGRKLNLLSDSRYRFERGVDSALVIPAMERATRLILDMCGGTPSEISVAGAIPEKNLTIAFHPHKIQKLSGVDMPAETYKSVLDKLGLTFEMSSEDDSDTLKVLVPSWRHDIQYEVDVVEEVLRLYGLDKIPVHSFSADTCVGATMTAEDKIRERRRWVSRRILGSRGMTEAFTWPFLSEKMASAFGGGGEDLTIHNPISVDLSVMRPSLLPNLIEAAHRNLSRGARHVALFELGAQYTSAMPNGQEEALAGIYVKLSSEKHWLDQGTIPDVWTVKGDALALIQACQMDPFRLQTLETGPAYYHPGRLGALCMGPQAPVAYFGELHPSYKKLFDLDVDVVMFEVFMSRLPVSKKTKSKQPLVVSSLQSVERDFAFIVDDSIRTETILKTAQKADRNLIQNVNLFDIYQGKGIEEGKKSVAIGILIQPFEKTLTDQEIKGISDKVISEVERATGGRLRS